MTQKQTYWLADADGGLIRVEGADERDRLAGAGWTVIDRPAAEQKVWCRHEQTAAFAQLPAGALDVWEARGWQPVVPPAEDTLSGLVVTIPATEGPAGAAPTPVSLEPTPPAAESPTTTTEKGK